MSTRVIIVISLSFYSFLRLIKLFKTDMGFFCCLMLYFQYIRKLYHWLLWKSCMQLLYLIFKVLYKLLHIIFTAIHLQWIRKISTSKRAVYISFRRFMSLYLFCMWCLTFSPSLHLIHLLPILLNNGLTENNELQLGCPIGVLIWELRKSSLMKIIDNTEKDDQ